jgi:hypothetical protein
MTINTVTTVLNLQSSLNRAIKYVNDLNYSLAKS